MGHQVLEYKSSTCEAAVSVPSNNHLSIIRDAIEYFQEKHSSRSIPTHDTEYLVNYVIENYIVVFIEEEYLLVLDIVEPWYSTKEVLQEVLVLRYREGNTPLSRVVSIMESIARGTSCASIEAGTMAAINQHEALARLYRQQGFETDYIALRKNVP